MKKILIVAATVLLSLGCPSEEDKKTAPSLAVTVDPTELIADGVNLVTVTVTGAGTAPITVSTTKGTFVSTGSRTATIAATSGTLDLLTCNSQVDGLCGGTVAISAVDASNRSGYAAVRFLKIENCSNVVDDDADGAKDCADADCDGLSCLSGGVTGTCTSGACVCTETSATETQCSDSNDDDCDGDRDCADADCTGANCQATGGGIGTCTAAGACTCTASGATETACGDGKDNDCDGQIDCMDADCDGLACLSGGTCASSACVPASCTPTPGQTTAETDCADSVDNDCDGAVDCGDSQCAAKQCDDLPSQVCSAGACTDSALGLSLEVKPLATRLAADGVSTTTVTIKMKREDLPVSQVITLSATMGTLSASQVQTGVTGEATVTFTAPSTGGVATISAVPFGIAYTATATIEIEAIGELSLVAVQYPVMGIRGSGYQEVDLVEVAVKDLSLAPFPAGLEVVFEHTSLGGSFISGPWEDTSTCRQVDGCYAFHAVTDANGKAFVSLHSGSITGPISVSVVAAAGGPTRTLLIANRVAVVGTRANGGSFSVVCNPANVEALRYTNCGTSLVDEQFTCLALLQDRFGNMLGAKTQVMFMSEASRVGQFATTPEYDPAMAPTEQKDLGSALGFFGTLGGYLPTDVAPIAGEPSALHALDGCGSRTHNPRDGLLTVAAIADGEEAFFDVDGNGVYDTGEPFTDLPEPFADGDDDAIHDGDGPFDDATGVREWFLDVNGNGVWDPPNGSWDYDTKIWTQTVVLYSGFPAGPVLASPGLYLGTRAHGPDRAVVQACTPTPAWGDFAVHPGTTDGAIVPTEAYYQLISSDQNFNVLSERTGYNWYMEEPANAVKYYNGEGSIPPTLGLFYAYWPCDVTTGTCATRCTTGRCVMKPSITSYGCGYSTDGQVSGYTQGPDGGTIRAVWYQLRDPDALKIYVEGTNL